MCKMSSSQAYVVTEMDKVIVAFRDTGSDKDGKNFKHACRCSRNTQENVLS